MATYHQGCGRSGHHPEMMTDDERRVFLAGAKSELRGELESAVADLTSGPRMRLALLERLEAERREATRAFLQAENDSAWEWFHHACDLAEGKPLSYWLSDRRRHDQAAKILAALANSLEDEAAEECRYAAKHLPDPSITQPLRDAVVDALGRADLPPLDDPALEEEALPELPRPGSLGW